MRAADGGTVGTARQKNPETGKAGKVGSAVAHIEERNGNPMPSPGQVPPICSLTCPPPDALDDLDSSLRTSFHSPSTIAEFSRF